MEVRLLCRQRQRQEEEVEPLTEGEGDSFLMGLGCITFDLLGEEVAVSV